MSEIKELEAQTALALGALGVSFAQTLVEAGTPPDVLAILQRKAMVSYAHLEKIGASQAAMMFGTFVRALRDPAWFDNPSA